MANMYAYIRGEELLNSLDLDYSNTTYSKSKMTDILLELRKLDKKG